MKKRKIYDLHKGWTSLTAEVLYFQTRLRYADKHPSKEMKFLKKRLSKNGGVALDVACGTGRHMFQLLRDGFNVHGLDASGDTLKLAKMMAKQEGFSTKFFRQKMEEMNVPNRYDSIYIRYGSFQIMADRQKAQEVLRRFWKHLKPGGQVIIDIWVTYEARNINLVKKNPEPEISEPVDSVSGDGKISTKYWEKNLDVLNQTYLAERICELIKDKKVIKSEMHRQTVRWFYKYEFIMMLEKAGFAKIKLYGEYTEKPATKHSGMISYTARRPE